MKKIARRRTPIDASHERQEQAPSSKDRRQRAIAFRFHYIATHAGLCLSNFYRPRYDISTNEWRIISLLVNLNGLSATEVGNFCIMDRVRVTRTVDKLVRRGFVDRREDAQDRRRIELTLTPAGRDVYAAASPVIGNLERALIASLTATERKALETILGKIERRCEVIFDEAHSVEPFL